MATTQHDGAQQILSFILPSWREKNHLTYETIARRMGREPNGNARAVAAMCDLLDAVSCLAGVPLLALVAVRAKNGHVNKTAWVKEYGDRREAIIERSLNHPFSEHDYAAIANALGDLAGHGTKSAWAIVTDKYSTEEIFVRLTSYNNHTIDIGDAINDLGTDEPEQRSAIGNRFARDPAVRRAVLERAKGTCEYCGAPGFLKQDGTRYVETHHIIALSHQGADRPGNVIALCPSDHREAHFGSRSRELEQAMISKLEQLTGRK